MTYDRYPIMSDTTLQLLVSEKFSIFEGSKNKEYLLLEYSDGEKTNRELIIEKYSKADLTAEADYIASGELRLVKAGTELLLPKNLQDIDLVAMTGRNLFVKDTTTFTAYQERFLDLLKQDGYVPAFRNEGAVEDVDIREYNISVWVWCRAFGQDSNVLMDITNFVESASTSVNGVQNTFALKLQPVNDNLMEMGDEFYSKVDIDKNVLETQMRSGGLPMTWLEKLLQQNDIVFIRFERLKMEKVEDRLVGAGLEVPSSKLPGKVFDMIGLIESVSSSYIAETTDLSIDIVGGDLTRLLIEDSATFFPLLFLENSETLFFNTQDETKWFKRNFLKQGVFENFFTYKLQSIKDSLGFVVNQLANLGVCNDDVFASYDKAKEGQLGGRRAETLVLTGDNRDQPKWNVVSGVWQIVDMLVDPQIQDRRIANGHISNPNGSLLSVINTFCQSPLVEFFGDTYGDKYTFVARQPPFTKNAIQQIHANGDFVDINPRDIERVSLSWEQTFYTWFQMDPRNVFLGKSESVALAYLPVIYFPEIAEAFGNKQFSFTDNYISNKAFTGDNESGHRDEFKSKSIEDFMLVLESYCYLPFTRNGSITLKRDRRLKAKTWVQIGNQFMYVDSVTNSFTSMGESVSGNTTIQVSRVMYVDYIFGKYNETLKKSIDYWSIIKLDLIRETLIQKMRVYDSQAQADAAFSGTVDVKIPKNSVKMSFGTDRDVFDFFLQRRFLYE